MDACTFQGIGYKVYFYVYGFLRSYFVPFTTLVAGVRTRNFRLYYLRTVILCVARSCCRACLLLLSHVASCQQVKSRDTAKTVIRVDVQGGPKMGPQTHDHNSVILLTDLIYFFTGRFLPW